MVAGSPASNRRPPVSLWLAWAFAVGMTAAVVWAAASQPSATHGMAFYGAYHQNGWNQLIHFFGVPAILFSGIVFASHLTVSSLEIPKNTILGLPSHQLSVGTIWAAFYVIYYLCIDPIGGTLFAPMLLAMYAVSVRWFQNDQLEAGARRTSMKERHGSVRWTGTGKVLRWAGLVQLLSWYMQIHPGHAILEGAKPALLDSLGASFSNAPLFAFYEGIWFLGWRLDLRDQVQSLIIQQQVTA